jgi:hypothetical protein
MDVLVGVGPNCIETYGHSPTISARDSTNAASDAA